MVKLKKGFTLIELLVVIAIIGILSSVVLASLNTARGKGADAAIKSNLNNMRPQAELFYDSGQVYTNVCADANMTKAQAAAVAAGGNAGGICESTATAWKAWAPLKSTNVFGAASGTDYWCVDNTGNSKVVDAQPAAIATTANCL